MRVCYFGTYSTGPGYPRNRVIIKGLRENGVEVVECHKELWKDAAEKIRITRNFPYNLKTIFRVLSAYLFLVINFFRIGSCDLVIVGYAGHFDVFLAKILNTFRRSPLVFDAFLSLYDTVVMDRKIIGRNSLKARILWLIDKYSCKIADAVILDTNEHIEYFVREFGLPREKFIRVFVGEDNAIFKYEGTTISNNNRLNVLFFGTYIPLHGIEYIIKAAEILKDDLDITFKLVGTGPLLDNTLTTVSNMKLKNIEFITRWVDYNELTKYIRDADICLGIFGDTDKAKRVIPCKVYNCMAMGKPVITGNSPAAGELLTDGENAVLCEMANPEDLSNAVLRLKNDNKLREKIGKNALKTYESHASPEAVGKTLIDSIRMLF